MTRRALIGLALCVVLFAASGVMGQTWRVEDGAKKDGFVVKKLTFTPGSLDTANYLDGAAALLNDSIINYSPAFGVSTAWTVAAGRCFYSTQDTVSVIDTLAWDLQTKFDNVNDSTWWTVATSGKADEDLINTNPATVDLKGYFDADTVGMGDIFRVKFVQIAEEAQWRGEDVSGVIPFNAVYHIYLMFVHKGNQ